MRRLLSRLRSRKAAAAWPTHRMLWKLHLSLDPGVVYVAAESAAVAIEQACKRLNVHPDSVLSAEMYDAGLDAP